MRWTRCARSSSALSHYDPGANDMSPEGRYRTSVTLTAQLGTVVATVGRHGGRRGRRSSPIPRSSHAANFLYMLTGKRPSALEARALDIALVLHADHEFNASTFAARVAAATLTDVHSAIVGRDRRAQGPAARRREHRRDEPAARDRAGRDRSEGRRDHPRQAGAGRRRFPGFGHRVYRTEDPRATHLRKMSEELGRQTGNLRWFQMSQTIEQVVKAREEAERRTSTSTRRRPTTRSAFRSICSRRCSRSAASPAGRRTCSSSTRTTA